MILAQNKQSTQRSLDWLPRESGISTRSLYFCSYWNSISHQQTEKPAEVMSL